MGKKKSRVSVKSKGERKSVSKANKKLGRRSRTAADRMLAQFDASLKVRKKQ
jgi:hypothetical protein